MIRTRGLTEGLGTPNKYVRKLQRTLYTKAKTEPKYRFYSLWDKMYDENTLKMAYQRCRANKGSAGIDNQRFEDIESEGLEQWLGKLQRELKAGRYQPKPLKRVWIPKVNGKLRPLGIPCIKDRVVQMAVTLILQPIFEPDFLRNQYGFRPRLDAKMAVRKVYYHVARYGRTEVVDADLKDYFTTIPHGALLKSIARRIADGHVLNLIKTCLESPVVEPTPEGNRRTTEARDQHRGTPQGGPLSPLLSNIYFRRFLKAWEQYGYERRLGACVVNYADDMVICCLPGGGAKALEAMTKLIDRLGLKVNQEKTRCIRVPEEAFDFLGYTFSGEMNKHGNPYIGTKPSKKALRRVIGRVHEETAINRTWDSTENRVREINAIIRGWAAYFDQGPVLKSYRIIEKYTERRLRRWLIKKHKQRGKSGYRQYPDPFLYEELGLIKLPKRMSDLSSAKV